MHLHYIDSTHASAPPGILGVKYVPQCIFCISYYYVFPIYLHRFKHIVFCIFQKLYCTVLIQSASAEVYWAWNMSYTASIITCIHPAATVQRGDCRPCKGFLQICVWQILSLVWSSSSSFLWLQSFVSVPILNAIPIQKSMLSQSLYKKSLSGNDHWEENLSDIARLGWCSSRRK